NAIVITARPPGGTNGGGPFDDFSPSAGPLTLAAGATVAVAASRTFTSRDPTGTWYAYATYQSANGTWHDGPSTFFIVEGVSRDAGATGSGGGGGSGGGAGDGGTTSDAPPWTGILDPARAIDWRSAGVPGGIPNRTVVCASLNPGDDINAAIASCPSGQ